MSPESDIEGKHIGKLSKATFKRARNLENLDVDSVRVTVKKPEVPIKGSVMSYAAVEIFREREQG